MKSSSLPPCLRGKAASAAVSFGRAAGRSRWLVCLVLAAGRLAWAEPFVPQDDQQVLERLPRSAAARQARELRRLRSSPIQEKLVLPAALQLARSCIEQSRAEADPRFLGYAQAALRPWWDVPLPPVEVLVLRATVRQSRHDFRGALADLDAALKTDPGNGQAWLTRMTVLQVLGEYEAARGCLLPLLRTAPGLVVTASAATLASLTGHAEDGYRMLRDALEHAPAISQETHLWGLTTLAEIAARLGHAREAESAFQRALGLGPRDPYLLGAYADFLLDRDRPAEVVVLLQEFARLDGLLLRLALAEQRLRGAAPEARLHATWLQERFAASAARGDATHRREESRFALRVLDRASEALKLACANWEVQREPADARVLLEAALACRDQAAALPVIDWLKRTHLEDVQLASLQRQLKTCP